jgi:TRAP-type C4-dicarboxylate transport system substrate-binding protein
MKPILIAALCAASVAHAQTAWKLATGYRAESFHTENIAQFSREIATATKGQLAIDLAPNGSLFKLGDIRQAVEEGKSATREWVRSVGHAASDIFVPYCFN